MKGCTFVLIILSDKLRTQAVLLKFGNSKKPVLSFMLFRPICFQMTNSEKARHHPFEPAHTSRADSYHFLQHTSRADSYHFLQHFFFLEQLIFPLSNSSNKFQNFVYY